MPVLTDRCLSGGGCAREPSNILANPRPTVGVEQSTSCFTCLGTQLTTALVCTLLPGGCTTQRSGVGNTDKQQNEKGPIPSKTIIKHLQTYFLLPESSVVMLKARHTLSKAANVMKSILDLNLSWLSYEDL